MYHGFDYSKGLTGTPQQRLIALAEALDWILDHPGLFHSRFGPEFHDERSCDGSLDFCFASCICIFFCNHMGLLQMTTFRKRKSDLINAVCLLGLILNHLCNTNCFSSFSLIVEIFSKLQ